MQIKTFHAKLKEQNIPISLEALTKYLADLGLKDVPQNMVNDLTADLKREYAVALELANQGKVELKTDVPTESPTQPPAPTQPEIPVDVPFANLDQVLGGVENVGVQIVVQTNDHINHVVEKVVNFAQAAPTLTAQRINQRMGLVGLENPVESILQTNRELCLNSLSRIDEAIAKAS